MAVDDTFDATWPPSRPANTDPMPGLVLLFSVSQPYLLPLNVPKGGLVIGRSLLDPLGITDGRMSRFHAHVSFDGRAWTVQDRDSRNGTFVDREAVSGSWTGAAPRSLRAGDSVFWAVNDLRPFLAPLSEVEGGAIIGPTLRKVWDQIALFASMQEVLHLSGETGVGKELAARHFHESSARRAGPFVAVNCAAIPPALAESLFFGTRRGAYSGATGDTPGYLLAADGGTLFLDEIGELDMAVQAKLLRVLETSEVLALGATRPRQVKLGICSATHAALRDQIAAGKFREDLFFRLGRPSIQLPPLRERPEDIPRLVVSTLAEDKRWPAAHSSMVAEAMGRAWPGNVRELLVEVRSAAMAAVAEGSAHVKSSHLSPDAGQARSEAARKSESKSDSEPEPERRSPRLLSREVVAEALLNAKGNVTAAAVALGVHRTQLRRLIASMGLSRPASDDGS